MANITRFEPFNELARLDPFSDLDNLFKGFMVRPVFQGAVAAPQMKLEVTEDDKAYTVKAEIPGVRKEDIHISVDGNLVSISAEVKKETEKKEGKKVVHSERYYGQVARSFTLAEEAPLAYKDVGAVVDASDHAGLAGKVVRLSPRVCIKG